MWRQRIVFGRVLLTETGKCHMENNVIRFYGAGDQSLAEFLAPDVLLNEFRCRNERCQRAMHEHLLVYTHAEGRLIVQMQTCAQETLQKV